IIFGAFVLLLMINPNLSCFGKKLKSPFYPVFRRKRMAREQELNRQARLKQIKTDDYGFKLTDDSEKPAAPAQVKAKEKAEDYGFKLD
ncbi:MAG: hypothetical protein ABSA30_05475, partial [Candidatus Aminicenantales bacterium]